MKVIYIKDGGYWFTIGNTYFAQNGKTKAYKDYFLIKNDNGYEHHVEKELFVSLSDIRDKKLKSIGIN